MSNVVKKMTEAGSKDISIHIITCRKIGLTNDQKLTFCAMEKQLPVISEDKSILMKAKKANLPYYNALMMLNWLLFKQKVNQEKYLLYFSSLKKIARYSQEVWEYGSEHAQFSFSKSYR